MIKEIPVNEDHLEADLEQEDMFLQFEGDTIDFDDFLTEGYKTWRHNVRMRGFRYVNILSDKDTRVITMIFCRCPISRIVIEDTLVDGQQRLKGVTHVKV